MTIEHTYRTNEMKCYFISAKSTLRTVNHQNHKRQARTIRAKLQLNLGNSVST
jgi:hypothetical protein